MLMSFSTGSNGLLPDFAGQSFFLERGEHFLVIEVTGNLERFGAFGGGLFLDARDRFDRVIDRFTALTHLPQQRCTPSTRSDWTFAPFAPVLASIVISGLLLLPKYPARVSAAAAFCTVAESGPVSVTVPLS